MLPKLHCSSSFHFHFSINRAFSKNMDDFTFFKRKFLIRPKKKKRKFLISLEFLFYQVFTKKKTFLHSNLIKSIVELALVCSSTNQTFVCIRYQLQLVQGQPCVWVKRRIPRKMILFIYFHVGKLKQNG